MLADLLKNRVIRLYKGRPIEKREQLRRKLLAIETGPFGWLVDIPSAILFGRNLKILATIYMTDKWNLHWYAQHYEALFRRDRRKRIKLLEIGVGGGNSLRMWRAFFPNGRIYGIDIHDTSTHDERRIKTFRGNQADSEFLAMVMTAIGTVDIIIDDGSHINEQVIFTFGHLFPHLADEGLYVVEDTQTSYWREAGGNETDRNDPRTTMGYFKSRVDGLNWQELRGEYRPTYLDSNIKSIAFCHNLIFIRKGANREAGVHADRAQNLRH